jgi:hypothetical protein
MVNYFLVGLFIGIAIGFALGWCVLLLSLRDVAKAFNNFADRYDGPRESNRQGRRVLPAKVGRKHFP